MESALKFWILYLRTTKLPEFFLSELLPDFFLRLLFLIVRHFVSILTGCRHLQAQGSVEEQRSLERSEERREVRREVRKGEK